MNEATEEKSHQKSNTVISLTTIKRLAADSAIIIDENELSFYQQHLNNILQIMLKMDYPIDITFQNSTKILS